jgi:short-subunit dehydrogenase
MALCICTREAVKTMKRCNIAGHIIHMNSITGHRVPNLPEPSLNVYPASKFAVTALTESLRQELRFVKSKIKVTVRKFIVKFKTEELTKRVAFKLKLVGIVKLKVA